MPSKIEIEGKQYDISDMPEASKKLIQSLQSIDLQLQEKNNLIAIFNKAKKAYISEMKSEMLSKKAGFDFSD